MDLDTPSPLKISSELSEPIPPFQYPIWVWGIALVVMGFLVLSLFKLPTYLDALIDKERGDQAFQQQKFDRAAEYYGAALKKIPTSEVVRYQFALTVFRNSDPLDDYKALQALVGVNLPKERWDEISPFMSDEMKSLFTFKED